MSSSLSTVQERTQTSEVAAKEVVTKEKTEEAAAKQVVPIVAPALSTPSSAEARHYLRMMGWEQRLYIKQLTSRASKGTLVYDFATMASYMLGRDALEKPLLDNPSLVLTTLDPQVFVRWIRTAVEDVALADALEERLSSCETKHDQMVAMRQLIYLRMQQYRRAVAEEEAAKEGASEEEASEELPKEATTKTTKEGAS